MAIKVMGSKVKQEAKVEPKPAPVADIAAKKAAPVQAPKPAQKAAPVVVPAAKKAVAPPPIQVEDEDEGDGNESAEFEAEPGDGVTTIEHQDGTVQETHEVVGGGIMDSTEPLAKVTVSMGMTKTTVPYENVKIMVSVTLPCATTAEDIEETYSQALEWVEGKVSEFSERIDAQLA